MTAPARVGREGEARRAVLTSSLRKLGDLKPAVIGHYLIKGWLDRGGFSVVYGASNIGKTFFVLDLALHVSAGVDWFGHRVAKCGPALYICCEGIAAFGNRIEAVRRVNPNLVRQAEESGMQVLPTELDICKTDDARQLAAMIRGNCNIPPSLIVIDTLARAMGTGNENDGADMASFFASVGILQAETGAHVMVVHHNGKEQSRGMRGHSNLRAALDTEVELTGGKVVAAQIKKQRDMAFGPPVHFSLRSIEIGQDEDEDTVTSAVVEQVDAPALGAIAANGDVKTEAQRRANAALRHLPTGTAFSTTDATRILMQARITKTDDVKSAAVTTRRLLRKMVEAGQITALEGGKFEKIIGA